MDFTFSQEQQMLLETTRRFIAKDYTFETRNRIRKDTPHAHSREVWQGLADLGLLSLNVPEADGGLGGGAIDTMLVMSAMGEGLVIEPFLSSAVLATRTLALLGSASQREAMLPALAMGELIAVLAHDEASTRFDRTAIETVATATGGGYKINGRKSVIAHAPIADVLFVSARVGDAQGPLGIFAVPRNATGLHQTSFHTFDGASAAELVFDNVSLSADALLGEKANDVSAQLETVLDTGLAAVCAEAVGALDRLLAATVEYTRTRKQFGTPIARFQALQHRMAEMVLYIEQARSMSYLAAVRLSESDPALRSASLSAAKVIVGQACRFVGQQAVQLHGGMGVTDELDVSHYFKRLMAIELQFGSTDQHLESYATTLE
ncbi:MAG: acyl-CoA dehydrogenase [Herminiimonas sp.]|nr:acyl-CoA dehydrogenase [Herminiimonas sp.]